VINSIDLVPGDIFAINNQTQFTCDCVLVSGQLMVNEAALTGSFAPSRKSAIKPTDTAYPENSLLFEGTKIIQVAFLNVLNLTAN